jgi:hypothetical protein
VGLSNYLPSSRLIQPGVCTSSTRPASPFEGQVIYETDTDKVLVYNGSAWYANWNLPWGIIGKGTNTSSQQITTSTADVTNLSVTWTAVTGRQYKYTVFLPNVNPAANSTMIVTITDGSNTVKTTNRFSNETSFRYTATYVFLEASLSGSVTRKVRAYMDNSTQTINNDSDATTLFLVEDIGPS